MACKFHITLFLRFGNVMFLVAGDDLVWCRKHLVNSPDVIVVDKAPALSDFALLSNLDHQIFSHGTFGVWIILLSKAKTVLYPAPYHSRRYSHHMYFDRLNLPNFIKINFTTSV